MNIYHVYMSEKNLNCKNKIILFMVEKDGIILH